MMKKGNVRKFLLLITIGAIVFLALLACRKIWIQHSYYPMGGEVTVVEKTIEKDGFYVLIEYRIKAENRLVQYTLEATKDQFDSLQVGDIIYCDRMQSELTHKGIIHKVK